MGTEIKRVGDDDNDENDDDGCTSNDMLTVSF